MAARSADGPTAGALPGWKLEDAKARFSQVVREACENGPQRVTVRGKDAVVILSAADYAHLAPDAAKPTLAALFSEGPFARLDQFEAVLQREQANFRDPLEF